MMLNKKSNPWMRSKALYILPVAAVALSAFATPEFTNHANAGFEVSGKVTENSENTKVLAKDSVQTEVVDITKLGLMEITRKKVYKTIAEQLAELQ